MMQITIPKPCHEDWNEMTANEQGRHCNVCCKTVVDFTSMTDEEVKHFFLNKKKEENVCGRFKNEQLHRIKVELPYNIYTLSMPLWKQFLTACLLAFSSMLFSCDAKIGKADTLGETIPFVMADDSTNIPAPPPPAMLGAVYPLVIDTTIQTTTCTTLIGDTIAIQTVETITQGMSVIEPVEPETEIPTMGKPVMPEPDTSQPILKGEIAIDSNTIINQNKIDSVNPKKDSNCNNEFIAL